LTLPATLARASDKYNASAECHALYGELYAYTIALREPGFLHQLVADTYATQHAGRSSASTMTVFGLVGLYLTCERRYSGRQVQRTHTALAHRARAWPALRPPIHANWLTVGDVLAALPGAPRALAIRAWADSVWDAWAHERPRIVDLVCTHLDC
jgi:hypothetical protein